MLFLILLSTSLGIWATIDMLSSDEKSNPSDDETASEQLVADEDLDSTDNYLQLGDKIMWSDMMRSKAKIMRICAETIRS